MDRETLAQQIDLLCRLEGSFVLRSGTIAAEYFDKYLFESDPQILRAVAEQMIPLIPPGTEILGGLELGGVPIATILSSLTSLPVAFVRKEAKTYGTRRLAEGKDVTGARITLVEDVITTGGAVRAAALALRAQSAHVSTVICAIDRSLHGVNPLLDAGVEVRSVLTLTDLDRARDART